MSKSDRFRYPSWCTTKPDNLSACAECPNQEDCDLQACFQILEASKGFFYSYELLLGDSKYPYFERSHEKAMERIKGSIDKLDQPTLFYAIAVNGALAAELALKYLAYRANHEFVQTHKLDRLLNDLSPKDRQEIMLRLEQRTGMSGEVIKRSVVIFSNVFTEARYFFSLGNKGISFLFDDFIRVVHDYAIEILYQDLLA